VGTKAGFGCITSRSVALSAFFLKNEKTMVFLLSEPPF
jgi:hypothetical protein